MSRDLWNLDDVTVTPGMTFEHLHYADPDWRPDRSKGQRYVDAPRALMRVTATQRGRVYYTYAADPEGTPGAFSMGRLIFAERYGDRLTPKQD